MSDVKSTRLAASGTVFGGPGRIKGFYIQDAASAGSLVLKDGGSGGTTVLQIDTPGDANGHQDMTLPGDGIRCETDIYATLTNVTAVTVFYA